MGGNDSPILGTGIVLHLGPLVEHPSGMDDADDPLLKLIARNVETLVPVVFGEGSGKGIPQLVKATGIPKSTIGRVVTPTGQSWHVTTLQGLAKGLKVQPWHLLLPDLKASRQGVVTSIEGMRAQQWPFPTLRREDLADLSPREMERLEKTIRSRLDELRADRDDDSSLQEANG